MVKGTTTVSKRGKTATVWRNAWGMPQGIQTTKTSETKGGSRSKSAIKWSAKRSSIGLGNPRGPRGKRNFTGGGF